MNNFALDMFSERLQEKMEAEAGVEIETSEEEDFFSFHGIRMTSEDIFADFRAPSFGTVMKEILFSIIFIASYIMLLVNNAAISTPLLVTSMLVLTTGMMFFHLSRFSAYRHQGFMVALNTLFMVLNCVGAFGVSILLLQRFLNL